MDFGSKDSPDQVLVIQDGAWPMREKLQVPNFNPQNSRIGFVFVWKLAVFDIDDVFFSDGFFVGHL